MSEINVGDVVDEWEIVRIDRADETSGPYALSATMTHPSRRLPVVVLVQTNAVAHYGESTALQHAMVRCGILDGDVPRRPAPSAAPEMTERERIEDLYREGRLTEMGRDDMLTRMTNPQPPTVLRMRDGCHPLAPSVGIGDEHGRISPEEMQRACAEYIALGMQSARKTVQCGDIIGPWEVVAREYKDVCLSHAYEIRRRYGGGTVVRLSVPMSAVAASGERAALVEAMMARGLETVNGGAPGKPIADSPMPRSVPSDVKITVNMNGGMFGADSARAARAVKGALARLGVDMRGREHPSTEAERRAHYPERTSSAPRWSPTVTHDGPCLTIMGGVSGGDEVLRVAQEIAAAEPVPPPDRVP